MTESSTPASDQLATAYAVLVDAVGALLDDLERPPTASEVRIAMKRRTYDGFDPKALGFKRFRDFLDAGVSAGHVQVIDRQGDVAVTLSESRLVLHHPKRIRRDLWRAVLDWSRDKVHYFDLQTDKVVTIPRDKVPLEPDFFGMVRQRADNNDESLVGIPSIDIKTQTEWMRQFAQSWDDDSLRPLLLGALSADKPAKFFSTVLRGDLNAQSRWSHVLGQHVTAHLREWQEDSPQAAKIRIEQEGSTPATYPSRDQEARREVSRDLLVTASHILDSQAALRNAAAHTSWSHGAAATSTSAERLRRALHRALDRMPEQELRALRIPAGYLLED